MRQHYKKQKSFAMFEQLTNRNENFQLLSNEIKLDEDSNHQKQRRRQLQNGQYFYENKQNLW